MGGSGPGATGQSGAHSACRCGHAALDRCADGYGWMRAPERRVGPVRIRRPQRGVERTHGDAADGCADGYGWMRAGATDRCAFGVRRRVWRRNRGDAADRCAEGCGWMRARGDGSDRCEFGVRRRASMRTRGDAADGCAEGYGWMRARGDGADRCAFGDRRRVSMRTRGDASDRWAYRYGCMRARADGSDRCAEAGWVDAGPGRRSPLRGVEVRRRSRPWGVEDRVKENVRTASMENAGTA